MNSGNSLPKRISSRNQSHITTLIMLSNAKGSVFHKMPKDIVYYIAGIIKDFPVWNIFDGITSELTTICQQYKKSCWFFKNIHHELACEVEEVVKIFVLQKKMNEKHAFIHLTIFIDGLTSVLRKKHSEKFLEKIDQLILKYDLHVLSEQSPWYLNDAHTSGAHVKISNLITALSLYTAQSTSFIIAYLEGKDFTEKKRNDLLQNLDKRYNEVLTFSSYEAMFLSRIEKEVDYHLTLDCDTFSNILSK